MIKKLECSSADMLRLYLSSLDMYGASGRAAVDVQVLRRIVRDAIAAHELAAAAPLQELMRRCREDGHQPTYSDLLALAAGEMP